MFIIHWSSAPIGPSPSPHGYSDCLRWPRAAFSHSASVGKRRPAHLQYALASFQLMCTTGWSSQRPCKFESRPSGFLQYAPPTATQCGASLTWSMISSRTAALKELFSTKLQPNNSASVLYFWSFTKCLKSWFVTGVSWILYNCNETSLLCGAPNNASPPIVNVLAGILISLGPRLPALAAAPVWNKPISETKLSTRIALRICSSHNPFRVAMAKWLWQNRRKQNTNA
mmetsp:Transcript_18150/g.50468  ORF Transcript_18150/g.50468 Transcript_18150/m.50468 type:complete len:228 (+) Transcript_18150:520-1203(+)